MPKVIDGLAVRSRANENRYRKYKEKHASINCHFCDLVKHSTNQIIKQTDYFLIVKNLFGYDLWDGCRVKEHLMIVPKRHVESLAGLSNKEMSSYLEQVVQFEAAGYSVYARASDNTTRSINHQHTHLIKIDNNPVKMLAYSKKPYLLWRK